MRERKSLGTLIAETPALMVDLAKAEVGNLKAEVRQKAKGYGVGAGILAAAGVFALYLLGWLLFTGFEALKLRFEPWLAALFVSLFLLLLVAILALIGLAILKRSRGRLESVDSIKDDINMVKGLGHASDGSDPLDDLPNRNGAAR